MGTDKILKTISINPVLAKRRKKKPSRGEINNKNKQRRRKETILSCIVMQRGTANNKFPVTDGQFLKSDEFTVKGLN